MVKQINVYTDQEIEVFDYLDELRESGVTNMYGAGRYLQEEFGFDKYIAKEFLSGWMDTFTDRHPEGE